MVFGGGKKQKLEEEVGRLRRALEELSILNDLARAISTSFETESIVSKVVQRSIQAIGAEQAKIHMVDDDQMVSGHTMLVVDKAEGQTDPHYHMTKGLMGAICHEKRPLLINDVQNAPRGVRLASGVRNLLCVPLMAGTRMIGVLSAYNKVGSGGFDEDDQRLLGIIAAQSAQVLERARLMEEEKSAERMREDVRLAERIQAGLLPSQPPEVPGYDMAGITAAARQVGGDYFDFIGLTDFRWALALGDVSGKGLPASLLMANLQATLRGQAFQDGSCHDCVAWCNRLLFRSTSTDKFATLFYAVLDARSHVMTYCNAGHEQPFLFSADGQVNRLTTGGLAVGILEEFAYQDDIVHIQPGDTLVVFSDGVTDLVNEDDEPFGEPRLLALLKDVKDLAASDMITVVRQNLVKHAGKAPPFDDVTLMVVKRIE